MHTYLPGHICMGVFHFNYSDHIMTATASFTADSLNTHIFAYSFMQPILSSAPARTSTNAYKSTLCERTK